MKSKVWGTWRWGDVEQESVWSNTHQPNKGCPVSLKRERKWKSWSQDSYSSYKEDFSVYHFGAVTAYMSKIINRNSDVVLLLPRHHWVFIVNCTKNTTSDAGFHPLIHPFGSQDRMWSQAVLHVGTGHHLGRIMHMLLRKYLLNFDLVWLNNRL